MQGCGPEGESIWAVRAGRAECEPAVVVAMGGRRPARRRSWEWRWGIVGRSLVDPTGEDPGASLRKQRHHLPGWGDRRSQRCD